MAKIQISKQPVDMIDLVKSEKNSTMYGVLMILPIAMLIYAFFISTPREILEGLDIIRRANDILITDYLLIAGFGATFVNSGLVVLINIFILYKLDLKPNGVIVSALFLLAGFTFMGKNIFNIWPFYIGGYIYSRYHGIPYKSVVVINMLCTALSPLTSITVQHFSDNLFYSALITTIVSGSIGFIMPTISAHFLHMHMGYNIYNMGVATGFVGIMVYAVIQGFGFEIQRNSIYLEENHIELIGFLLIFNIVLIVIGCILNNKSFVGYRKVLKRSGRLITDIVKQDGFGLALINMGLLGLLSMAYIVGVGGTFNGPVIAALLTVTGFGAFGKHIKNVTPIIIGVSLGMLIMGREANVSTLVISALFGTTLAPIAGEFGALWGILAGVLHSAVVLSVGDMHGGLMLYNNGLAGGIVATLLIPMIDAFKREKKNET